jgi:arogenate dehydrogenase (NADP+), plant
MTKIGYQGEQNCYTFQVIKKFLNNSYDLNNYKTFDKTFDSLTNNEVDFIMVPIENSTGGSIYINYDLFYKHNITIHNEYTFQVQHTVYIHTDSHISNIKYILSHPQALLQCKQNINKNKWITVESWDTTGSISDMLNKGHDYACIAPSGMEKYNPNIKPILHNFNDDPVNITRFYLISNRQNIDQQFNDNDHCKFSLYITIKDQIGILSSYLNMFSSNNINLTKIESRPLEGHAFKYIFFIEGLGLYKDLNLLKYTIDSIHFLGIFHITMDKINIPLMNNNLDVNIGIVGFGRFGQFIGKELSHYGFNVCCTSRTNYEDIACKYGIKYLNFNDFIKEKIDIVIFATSILSFKETLLRFPISYWEDKIVTDVLSVKEYPFKLMKKYIGKNMLLSHPMFGPDSAQCSWKDKKFIYWKHNILYRKLQLVDRYLEFWKDKKCDLIELNPAEHDNKTASSQFITHFIGRAMTDFNYDESVATDGFKALTTIKRHSINDSWDLFKALAICNSKSKDSIRKLIYNMFSLYNELYQNEIPESKLSNFFSKVTELQKSKEIINSAVGIPSWKPNIDSPCQYSTAKGNDTLIDLLLKYYDNYNISLNKDNIIITSGAKPAVYMSIKYLTAPFTKWIIPKPYWSSYGDIVKINYGISVYIHSSIENNWECDLNEIEQYFLASDVNGIIISNPNNPTGKMYSDEWINKLILLCKTYNKYIIVDEVYIPLVNKPSSYCGYEKQVIINSFSKGWGIPGYRIGWMIAKPAIISNIVKMQSTMLTCAPTVSQDLAIKLLNNAYKPDLSILKKAKDELTNLFIQKGWKCVVNKDPSIFIFPYNENIDINKVSDNLLNEGLAVMNGSAFGIDNALRLTIWNDEEKLDKMKIILNKVL